MEPEVVHFEMIDWRGRGPPRAGGAGMAGKGATMTREGCNNVAEASLPLPMNLTFTRRGIVAAALLVPLTALPGCATRLGDVAGLEDAVRRLLVLSSQRAFARLIADEGFFRDDLARIELPPQLGGGAVTAALAIALGTRAVQQRLLRVVNDAAAAGARRAAPIVADSIRDMTIADARAIVRGGPTAATDHLARSIRERLFDSIYPAVGEALRLAENGVIQRVLQVATGINFIGLQADVARKTSAAIYGAIGREEAAIRRDPPSSGDPVLAGLLSAAR